MNNELIIILYNFRVYLWLLAALCFVAAELSTPGLFFFLAFAAGSCAGALCAWVGFSLVTQALIALSSSLVVVWFLRKSFSQNQHTEHVKTGYEALAGQKAIVLREITPYHSGLVKAKDGVWSAKTKDDTTFSKGTRVIIVQIEGNHLIVKH